MKWTDLKYLIAYILPATGFVAVLSTGIWTYSSSIFAFIFIPILELFAGRSKGNLTDIDSKAKEEASFFDWLLYLNLPLTFGLIAILIYKLNQSIYELYEIIGMISSVGIIIGACGINVAHELGHKSGFFAKTTAKILLIPALYMHFYIEHNRGHHLHVGTPEDPATSKFGEMVYKFWVRSTWGSYKHSWILEAKRLTKSELPIVHWSNEMIQFHLIQLIYLLIVYSIGGFVSLCAIIMVAGIAILMLETINYIEHYGLERKKMASGRYEKVEVFHSWNSNHEVGRLILYELTRHSDHHFKAAKKYQVLKHYDESPQLPFGYPCSMLISFIPPLWFKIMNPIVEEIRCR